MTLALIALGSNVGNRDRHIRQAIAALYAAFKIVATAPWFETEPVGMAAPTPAFINTAIALDTTMPPTDLLRHLQTIETALGQTIHKHNGDRIIDLDIIAYGGWVVDAPDLTIPHPRFRTRHFVLEPLTHIAPDWVDPVSGQSIRTLFEALAA